MRGLGLGLCAIVVSLAASGTAGAASRHGLDMYTAKADAKSLAVIRSGGYDVAESHLGGGQQVDLALTAREARRIRADGVDVSLKRNAKGQTVRQQADAMAASGYNVYRSYDEAGGIRDELYALARRYPAIAKLEVIGHTLQGREIIALKVTKNANQLADGARPATLYMGTVHAREWIATEVDRRLMHHFIDNYADGTITNGDGVDLNRNYNERWDYDNEGSSTEWASQTYRGTAPASEPEVKAHQALIDRMKFKFLLTYHSYGPLLLYAYGWQVKTPSFDDPLFVEYTGTDANPAVAGYDPGVGADLYTTNGTTDDYSYAKTGALSWTPELSEGCDGCGFVFLDEEKSGNPLGNFKFSVSYGDPQPVQAIARRSLGAVSLKYRINGGAARTATTSETSGGRRYGSGGDAYYHLVRGAVTRTSPGDRVEVWFEDADNASVKSDSFTYSARSESGRRVLVVAAEDYSGISPVYKKTNGPSYLSYYLDALAANGYAADVYDVDANGRTAPSPLGVLGHYDAVVWYTGDDVITRDPGMAPGTASRLANDELLAMRQYLDEGGRLLFTGKYAGLQYAQGYEFDLEHGLACDPDSSADGCEALSDDFLQYYLGAYLYNEDAGTTSTGKLYDVLGVDNPFDGLSWSFGGPSANNQDHSASFITTSGILPRQRYPQFDSWPSAKYVRPGGPFDPHTGSYYAYSQIADVSYKRLTRTVDLTGKSSGNLSFWISRDTEPDWDFVFVEAHTVGENDWTTLPDANGHTSQSTGPNDPDLASCPAGWHDLHPWLAHYQTFDGSGACTSTGTSGEWNAATGRSSGREQRA